MLSYDQPIERAKPKPRPAGSAAGFSVLELVQLLWQRKIAIVSAALICACLAVAIGKSLSPKYTASAQLYVDPRELQLVERELTPRAQDVSGLSMVVESQSRLITSNNVLLQVIKDTNLASDPEFGGGAAGKGFMASLLGLFGVELKPTAAEQQQVEMNALDALNRHINVKKTDRTFIVDVDVWSYDPAKAAMLANAVSKAYLAESKQSQGDAARRATRDLSGRLKELQQRLRNAEETLATYKAQNNFVGSQDNMLTDQQLSASNQRLAAAHALALDAQAKYDQIEASRKAATDIGAIPEALQSPTIANLRSQYADAKKRQAELQGELGPKHPALRQVDQQVEDLKRTIKEEVDRIAQAAKNDVTRARDYETSLTKTLDTQKHQSVQMSQASVRLRELERDVDASRDVYQSFLKRSRETEEQESLNTSSARIIGDATIPQRRTFPPAMSLLAMVGFVFGGLAAAAWIVAASQLTPGANPARRRAQPNDDEASERSVSAPASRQAAGARQTPEPAVSQADKPVIAELQEADVVRTLGGILPNGNVADVTRFGWPTLRTGGLRTAFASAMHEMLDGLMQRTDGKRAAVLAVIGIDDDRDRSVVAMNIALAAARGGAKVLMIDADVVSQTLTNKVARFAAREPRRVGWLPVGGSTSSKVNTTNGITIVPAVRGSSAKASEAIRAAIGRGRSGAGYDLVILDGPAMPWGAAERELLRIPDGLVAVLPGQEDDDVNACLDYIITGLDGAEHKLVGVVLNELTPTVAGHQRQYA